MKWTIDQPTVSGWYWVYIRHNYAHTSEEPEVLCMYLDWRIDYAGEDILLFRTYSGSGGVSECDYLPGNALAWLGPIEAPEAPNL